jgi:osmotically-inducible protein OsmY
MDGSQLEEAVKSKLQGDDQLRSVDVSADAEKNAVTLKGTVPSQEARKKAVELARSAHSGITVNDEMEVKPVG